MYMKKIITEEQIKSLLQAIYQTNVTAQNFDAIAKLFNELPKLEDVPNPVN